MGSIVGMLGHNATGCPSEDGMTLGRMKLKMLGTLAATTQLRHSSFRRCETKDFGVALGKAKAMLQPEDAPSLHLATLHSNYLICFAKKK